MDWMSQGQNGPHPLRWLQKLKSCGTSWFQIAKEPDIGVADKQEKKAVVVDVAKPSNSIIRKKEHEKLEKYRELKEELKGWVKASVL